MNSYAMHMVSVLLQDGFVELLKKLPDGYFNLDEESKTATWRSIWLAIDRGETDTDKLASLAYVQIIGCQ
jgi:hypothetical protein